MNVLKLTLKKCWFEMHLQDKEEEYREITPFWCARLLRIDGRKLTKEEIEKVCKMSKNDSKSPVLNQILFAKSLEFVKYDRIHAFNGAYYSESLPNFQKEIKNIGFGNGRKEWGANDNLLFVIKVGKVIKNQ